MKYQSRCAVWVRQSSKKPTKLGLSNTMTLVKQSWTKLQGKLRHMHIVVNMTYELLGQRKHAYADQTR